MVSLNWKLSYEGKIVNQALNRWLKDEVIDVETFNNLSENIKAISFACNADTFDMTFNAHSF